MLVSPSKGLAFQRRPATGGTSVSTAARCRPRRGGSSLQRSANLFSAYESADGVSWTLVGTEPIPMETTVYVGLGVTSQTTAASDSMFDNVTIR